MVHLLGLDNDVVKHGPLRLWAADGMIKIEDGRDNSYTALSVKEALERVSAINEMIGNSSGDGEYADEITRLQRFVEGMVELCKKARVQGMPTDATARKERRRRHSTSVIVPGKSTAMDM